MASIGMAVMQTTVDDMKRLGEEAIARDYNAVKTNPILFDGECPRMLNPGFLLGDLDLAGLTSLGEFALLAASAIGRAALCVAAASHGTARARTQVGMRNEGAEGATEL